MADENMPAPMPRREIHKPLAKCGTLQEAFENKEFLERIQASVPAHVSAQTMLRACIQAVSRTPALLKVEMRDYLGACLTIAQLGLVPNTPLGHAYFIPFEKNTYNKQTRQREYVRMDLQVIIGYKGFIDLAYRHPKVLDIYANVVMPGDDWDYGFGTVQFVKHKPLGLYADGAEPSAAYMVAHTKDGGAPQEVMSWGQIVRVRNGSQGFQSAKRSLDNAVEKGWKPPAGWTESPWVKHQEAMARKTVVRAGFRWLPVSLETAAAIEMDAVQERASIDFGKVIDQDGGVVSDPAAIDSYTRAEDETDQVSDEERDRDEKRNRAPAADPTAAHAIRTPAPAASKPATAPAAPLRTATATKAAKAPEPPPAPPAAPFHEYLTNLDGDPEGEPFTTHAAFVAAFAKVAFSDDPQTLAARLAQNGDALDIIEADADDAARNQILAWRRFSETPAPDASPPVNEPPAVEAAAPTPPADEVPTEPADSAPTAETHDAAPAPAQVADVEPLPASDAPADGINIVDLPMKAGKANWPQYSRDIAADLATYYNQDELLAWWEKNKLVFRDAPEAIKSTIREKFVERRRATGGINPTTGAAATPPAGEADPNEGIAAELIKRIRETPTKNDLIMFDSNVAIRAQINRLKREREDLHTDVMAAFNAKRESFI